MVAPTSPISKTTPARPCQLQRLVGPQLGPQRKNVVQSVFVEEAGEWVIVPGEATNVLLKLLRANEGFGLPN